MLRSVLAFSLVSLTLTACGSKSSSSSPSGCLAIASPHTLPNTEALGTWPPRRQENTSPHQHALFSTIDPAATPWQASLYHLNLATKSVERLLTGESGDTILLPSDQGLFLFNRSADSQNYRRITLSNDHPTVTGQQSFASGDLGDPHDALSLGRDRVLLAHYTQGCLVVMQQSTGTPLAVVDADWDLPEGINLKPEALIAVKHEGKRLIYVVHQALSLQNGLITANGSQQVFVLEDDGETVKAVDLDPAQARVQGIKIKGSMASPVRHPERDKLLLVSLCSRLMDTTKTPCQNAVEEIDPATHQVTLLWDLQGTELFLNGSSLLPGPDQDSFFVPVEQGSQTFVKKVVKVNVKSRTVTTSYAFNEKSGGFWGMLYDKPSQTLLVGDIGDSTVGKWVITGDDGTSSTLPLDGVPYAAAFIP